MKHDTHDQQPITGFALYADGSLLLKRGHGCRPLLQADPHELGGDDFKALIWTLEAALGLRYNELQFADPASIDCVLKVIAHCHANRPRDPLTEAVLTFARPAPIYLDFPPDADEPSGSGVREPMVGLLPRPPLPHTVRSAGVASVGAVSEAGRLAVA
jgi:hypothetical protein